MIHRVLFYSLIAGVVLCGATGLGLVGQQGTPGLLGESVASAAPLADDNENDNGSNSGAAFEGVQVFVGTIDRYKDHWLKLTMLDGSESRSFHISDETRIRRFGLLRFGQASDDSLNEGDVALVITSVGSDEARVVRVGGPGLGNRIQELQDNG